MPKSAKTKSEKPKVESNCLRCKTQREMVDPIKTKTKNGRSMLRGKCIECDCNMCKFIKDE